MTTTVRRIGWLVALTLGLGLGCGTMVESTNPGSTRKDGGLTCNPDNVCDCIRCTSTEECAEGLSCVRGFRRGESCPGALFVCSEVP